MASPEYATELVEIYWGSLLRDVAFTDYATNPTAIAAAQELTELGASYTGPKDAHGVVTPDLLFRGGLSLPHKRYFAGETVGPYISQLCPPPTKLGAQPLDQKMETLATGVDYLTDLNDWQAVQNGSIPPPPAPGTRGSICTTAAGLAPTRTGTSSTRRTWWRISS